MIFLRGVLIKFDHLPSVAAYGVHVLCLALAACPPCCVLMSSAWKRRWSTQRAGLQVARRGFWVR